MIETARRDSFQSHQRSSGFDPCTFFHDGIDHRDGLRGFTLAAEADRVLEFSKFLGNQGPKHAHTGCLFGPASCYSAETVQSVRDRHRSGVVGAKYRSWPVRRKPRWPVSAFVGVESRAAFNPSISSSKSCYCRAMRVASPLWYDRTEMAIAMTKDTLASTLGVFGKLGSDAES